MKVAVTGALGFIGQHVLADLANMTNIEVVSIIRPSSRTLPEKENNNWISIDITNPPEDLFKLLGEPDVLIHLAWNNLQDYFSLGHYESELPIHYSFLKKVIEQGLKNLFVSGTCLEYGLQCGELSPVSNTQPVTPYAFSKDTLRKQLEYLQTKLDFNLTWARLFYLSA